MAKISPEIISILKKFLRNLENEDIRVQKAIDCRNRDSNCIILLLLY